MSDSALTITTVALLAVCIASYVVLTLPFAILVHAACILAGGFLLEFAP